MDSFDMFGGGGPVLYGPDKERATSIYIAEQCFHVIHKS
jgi:hypothetical protein